MAQDRLYVHGPRMTWPGVCEVSADGRRYLYHRHWPMLEAHWDQFSYTDQLSSLVSRGEWQTMLPTSLQLPEGL